jgi:hypothetical protein
VTTKKQVKVAISDFGKCCNSWNDELAADFLDIEVT